MATIDRTPYRATWRDRIAVALANAALRLATPEYRGFIKRACINELTAREAGPDGR